MMQITRTQVMQRWDTIPDAVKEEITSEVNSDFIWRTCEDEHLPEPKKHGVSRIAGYVILGFIHPGDFARELKDSLQLNPQAADAIAKAIDERIFDHIKDDLDRAYEPLSSLAPAPMPLPLKDIQKPFRPSALSMVSPPPPLGSPPSPKASEGAAPPPPLSPWTGAVKIPPPFDAAQGKPPLNIPITQDAKGDEVLSKAKPWIQPLMASPSTTLGASKVAPPVPPPPIPKPGMMAAIPSSENKAPSTSSGQAPSPKIDFGSVNLSTPSAVMSKPESAPKILQEEPGPLRQASGFSLNIPIPKSLDANKETAPMKPALLEFASAEKPFDAAPSTTLGTGQGKPSGTPSTNSGQIKAPRVVHYMELRTPLEKIASTPSAEAGREIEEITAGHETSPVQQVAYGASKFDKPANLPIVPKPPVPPPADIKMNDVSFKPPVPPVNRPSPPEVPSGPRPQS